MGNPVWEIQCREGAEFGNEARRLHALAVVEPSCSNAGLYGKRSHLSNPFEVPPSLPHNPFAPPDPGSWATAGISSDADAVRTLHLAHEGSVQSVGLLYVIGGTGGLLLGGILLIGTRTDSGPDRMPMFVVGSLLIALSVLQLFTARGLRRLQPWARIPAGVISGIGLLAIPLGTIINGYILYLLFSSRGRLVFSDHYKTIMQQTPHIRHRTSIVVWILLILLLSLFVIGATAALLSG
jgi:hypothetical protein